MHKTMLAAVLLMFLTGPGCTSKPGLDEKFNGMYKLDKFESYDSIAGKWNADKWGGKDTDGFIQYDGKGHMSVHLYPRGYKDFDTHKKLDSLDRAGLIEWKDSISQTSFILRTTGFLMTPRSSTIEFLQQSPKILELC